MDIRLLAPIEKGSWKKTKSYLAGKFEKGWRKPPLTTCLILHWFFPHKSDAVGELTKDVKGYPTEEGTMG